MKLNSLHDIALYARRKLAAKSKGLMVSNSECVTKVFDESKENGDVSLKIKKMFLNDIVVDPIGQLIDRKLYDSFDEISKQRYVFKLSRKFVELKQQSLCNLKTAGD